MNLQESSENIFNKNHDNALTEIERENLFKLLKSNDLKSRSIGIIQAKSFGLNTIDVLEVMVDVGFSVLSFECYSIHFGEGNNSTRLGEIVLIGRGVNVTIHKKKEKYTMGNLLVSDIPKVIELMKTADAKLAKSK